MMDAIPLPALHAWGRAAFWLGILLAVAAFGGVSFRPGGRWGIGRSRQIWDAKAVLSIPVTFVLIIATGYIGSFVVLVPGAQTLESLKDLAVFLSIVLFGYPALITVPLAYGLSDLIEGIPPRFLLEWLPGYFINPACFWIAHQLIGRDPDFRRSRTWGKYLVFVALFMAIEPVLWGYICSGEFTPAISYRNIASALFLTTSITWALAPVAMLGALPLARRFGLFWAEIPEHVFERAFGGGWTDPRGAAAAPPASRATWPIRLVIVAPIVALVLLTVSLTAIVTLRTAQSDANLLALRLHRELADNINWRLDELLSQTPDAATAPGRIAELLRSLPSSNVGVALVVDGNEQVVASSRADADAISSTALTRLRDAAPGGVPASGVEFRFQLVTEHPLERTTWLVRAAPYSDRLGGHTDWAVLTLMPESYFLAGVHAGSSRSAMVVALALALSLALGIALAGRVTSRLRAISAATESLAAGDLGVRAPGSRIDELATLGRAFNHMAERLAGTLDDMRAEVAVRRERETFLRLAQEAAEVGSWEWDVRSDRFRWSDQLARMVGIRGDEFDGTRAAVLAFCHPDDVDRLGGLMDRMRAGDDPGPFDCRVRPQTGGVRDLWFLGHPAADEDGAVVKVLGIAVDITERKRMENLLAAEAGVLGMIAADAELPDVLAALASSVDSLSKDTLTSILLFDAEQGTVRHGAAPSLPEAFCRAIDGLPIGPRAGSCGTAMYRREPVIVSDIETDPLWDDYRELARPYGLRACWSTPIVGHEQAVLGSFALYYREPKAPEAVDFELIERATRLAGLSIERARAREALRANESRLRQEKQFVDTLMDSLPGVVMLFDNADGRLTKWNRALERVTGHDADDLAGLRVAALLAPADASALERRTGLAATGGQRALEVSLLTRDGRSIPFYVTVVEIVTAQGPHTLGVGIDISDRRRLEAQFQQAQKMEAVGHLAAGVAHDFNNLLTVISGYAQLIEADTPASGPGREAIDAVLDAGERAAALTRQLLSFSRKSVLQPKVLDINVEVRETEQILRRVIGEDVRLTVRLAPSLPAVKVDPVQLSQILMNLAVNAKDAMPNGGDLMIETGVLDLDALAASRHPDANAGRYVALSVSDTGAGMSPEVAARVFEPFFTTKGIGRGTGLGLAMVHGVVRQSGGYLDLTTALGRGTVFHLYFPAAEASAPASQAMDPTAPAGGGTETILFVEDDPGVRGLSLRALQAQGYRVLVAVSGEDALRVADGHGRIDLMVTDVVMPGLSGREAAEILSQRYPGLRVLFASGYTEDAVVRYGVFHDEVPFLAKPYTPAALARKVREVLDRR